MDGTRAPKFVGWAIFSAASFLSALLVLFFANQRVAPWRCRRNQAGCSHVFIGPVPPKEGASHLPRFSEANSHKPAGK